MSKLAILHDKLATLRAQFIEQLPNRVSTVAQALLAANAVNDAGTVRNLERAFHSLAGIAGTYLIDDIFTLAAAGEALCAQAAGMLDAAQLQEANSLVARLHAAAVAQAS